MTRNNSTQFLGVIILLGALFAILQGDNVTLGSPPAKTDADLNPRTVYFSTGDNQHLISMTPLDSKANIEAAFDSLHKLYKVKRIWWRGGQDEVWAKQFQLREENRFFARVWEWWRHLSYEKVGTNRIAVKAAHDRGMEIWMAYGLFDNGSQADASYVDFPYAIEDRLRVEHPEWAPVNKWGTWRQGGPIEFCYPEARKAMADYLAKYVIEGGYDGISFLTYAENYSTRYEDEFGYNQPIVDEFKKRHGVDIRTQPFDKAAWAKLRGEYLTLFFQDLHDRLKKHSKKIAVLVDGKEPHLPWQWNIQPSPIRTAGKLYLDWETWAKKGIVDEVNLGNQTDEKTIAKALDAVRDTSMKISVFRSRGELPPKVPRLMWLGPDVETGFEYENYIDYPDEKIPVQPADGLKSDDVFARRRILTAARKGKQKIPLEEVVAAMKDSDVFTRRLALQVLGIMKGPKATPAIEAALADAENSIRCQAALILAELPGPQSLEKLLEAVAREESGFQFNMVAVPDALKKMQADGKLSSKQKELLGEKIGSGDTKVREAVLFCFKLIGAPATPAIEKALLQAVESDANPWVRELALVNLQSSFGPTPAVLAATRKAMADKDQAVGVRAAAILARLAILSESKEEKARVLRELTAIFRQYGDGCQRADADWGFRVIGPAMINLGTEGKMVLEDLLNEKDRRLADLAWRVLYLKQDDTYHRITEKVDEAAQEKHPFLRQKNLRQK